MKISIITLFPQMISGFFAESIIKKAQEKGAVEIEIINLRDFALDKYGTVDDRPYGGGAGMVLRPEPLAQAIKKAGKGHVVLTSAKGHTYTQKKALEFANKKHVVIIAGHYEGVDERAMTLIDEEISIGDFVLTGGEIPTATIVDSVVRLLPGVLKKEEATQEESFFEVRVDDIIRVCGEDERLGILKKHHIAVVQLLEYPHYTRPDVWNGETIPEILLSGNHEEIRKWRIRQAYKMTVKKRPDLIEIL